MCRYCRGANYLADEAEALLEAERIGYPVMLKSTAGGGGIGMRLVWNAEELKDAYTTVSYLAQANFKDAGFVFRKVCGKCSSYRSANLW